MVDPFDELIETTYRQVSPCQKKPWKCEPRQVKHVSFDADGVIWHIEPHAIASSVHGPFTRIDDNTVEGHTGGWHYDEKARPEPEPPQPAQPSLQPEMTGLEWPEEAYPMPEKGTTIEAVWLPQQQAWYEKIGSSVLALPRALAPRPPKDRHSKRTEFVSVGTTKHESAKLSLPKKPPPLREFSEKRHDYGNKVRVTLLPGFRDTLEELKKRGITKSVISLNTPGSVKDILKALELDQEFVEINDTWQNKGKVFSELTERQKVAPWQTVFVDDTMSNVDEVERRCGLALHMGEDIKKPMDILKYIRTEGQ